MPSWRKRFAEMVADPNPCNYTYGEAAGLLKQLGFTLASKGGTSHRKWRLARSGVPSVIIGLVDRGTGPMKRAYIVQMVKVLRENGLVPEGESGEHDLD